MLIVYDGKAEIAYWLHIQSYFQKLKEFDLAQNGKTLTVYLGISDVVEKETMREFARIKSEALLHWWKRTNHAD